MPYSTGSSVVMILSSILFNSLSAAYSVVVFPEPVGPVTSTMPLGRLMTLRNIGKRAGIHADFVQIQLHDRCDRALA